MCLICSTRERQLADVSIIICGYSHVIIMYSHVIIMSSFIALYEFCLDEGFADAALIAKWKKVIHH